MFSFISLVRGPVGQSLTVIPFLSALPTPPPTSGSPLSFPFPPCRQSEPRREIPTTVRRIEVPVRRMPTDGDTAPPFPPLRRRPPVAGEWCHPVRVRHRSSHRGDAMVRSPRHPCYSDERPGSIADRKYFNIHYGQGDINFGPDGVDLSMFRSAMLGISRPTERTLPGLEKWLLRTFKINSEEYGLDISTVASRVTERPYWELVPIKATRGWRRYVEIATERGQPLALLVQAKYREQTEEALHEPVESTDVEGAHVVQEEVQEEVQQFPLPVVHTVPPHVHQVTRRCQSAGALWGPAMVPWVEQWEQPLDDLVDEDWEYDDRTYDAYLRWYVPATRTRVGYTPPTEIVHVPSVSDTYSQHHQQAAYQAHDLVRQSNMEARHAIERIQEGIQMTASEVLDTFRRIYEKTTRAIRLTNCCVDLGALAPVSTAASRPSFFGNQRPRAPTPNVAGASGAFQGSSGGLQRSFRPPQDVPGSSGGFQGSFWPSHNVPGSSGGFQGSFQPRHDAPGTSGGFRGLVRPTVDVPQPSTQAAATFHGSLRPPPASTFSAHAYISTWDSPEAATEMNHSPVVEPPAYQGSPLPANFSDYFFGSHQEIGPSQLSEAPPVASQPSQPEHAMPEPQPRPQRDVEAPDRFTFPSTQLERARKSRADGSVGGVKPKRGRA